MESPQRRPTTPSCTSPGRFLRPAATAFPGAAGARPWPPGTAGAAACTGPARSYARPADDGASTTPRTARPRTTPRPTTPPGPTRRTTTSRPTPSPSRGRPLRTPAGPPHGNAPSGAQPPSLRRTGCGITAAHGALPRSLTEQPLQGTVLPQGEGTRAEDATQVVPRSRRRHPGGAPVDAAAWAMPRRSRASAGRDDIFGGRPMFRDRSPHRAGGQHCGNGPVRVRRLRGQPAPPLPGASAPHRRWIRRSPPRCRRRRVPARFRRRRLRVRRPFAGRRLRRLARLRRIHRSGTAQSRGALRGRDRRHRRGNLQPPAHRRHRPVRHHRARRLRRGAHRARLPPSGTGHLRERGRHPRCHRRGGRDGQLRRRAGSSRSTRPRKHPVVR